MEEILNNELIQIKQLPVILEQLAVVKQDVVKKTEAAVKMVCTEDNYKAIKKVRTTLSKELKEWETKRKEVKTAVMTPYENFEKVYKDCISEPYKAADADLKQKIDNVEDGLKAEKRSATVKYFTEYAESLGIDFVKFEDIGCNINMSVSLKKLKEQVKAFLDKTMDDLKLIAVQEHKADILVEYKQSLNVAQAITSVSSRYMAIETEKARITAEEEERKQALENEKLNSQVFEPFAANIPTEIENPEEIQEEFHESEGINPPPEFVEKCEATFPLTFTVYGTKEQLKDFAVEVKRIINERGMKYE